MSVPQGAAEAAKSFTDIFIRRPVMASVVSLMILLLGLQAIFSLQVRQYPQLSNAVITVSTIYVGATADVVQGFLTTPLQQAIATADGIDYMDSVSQQGVSTINAYLRLDYDADAALADIMAKVNQVRNQLPSAAQDPVITKTTGDQVALMYLGFSSDQMNAEEITEYLARAVQPILQTLDGVAQAQILGNKTFAMRVWVDPKRLAAFDLTPSDLNNALLANNYQSAAGQINSFFVLFDVDAATGLQTAEQFSDLVIKSDGNTIVRVRDVATVELGPSNTDSSVIMNGTDAIFIAVTPTPTANSLSVVDEVEAALPAIENQLPASMTAEVSYNGGIFISASIDEVVHTLGEATVIVILVMLLFLGSFRAVVIPLVTIPLSLVGVCFLLLAMGYSLNLLTLLAMVLAIGLVVDDAIVVVENVHRHIAEGLSPFQAALKGAAEIATPVIAMTLTLAAVYAPIGFIGGLTGNLFREFAFTLAGSVIISGIIALTLSPMMCSKILSQEATASRLVRRLDAIFDGLRARYERRLAGVIAYRQVVIVMAAIVLTSCYVLFVTAPEELAPVEDQGGLFVNVTAPKYTNLEFLETYTGQLNGIYESFPETQGSFIINGSNGVNQAISGMLLKPWQDRDRSQQELKPLLQKKLHGLAGVKAVAFPLPSLPGASGLPVQFVISTVSDYATLYQVLETIKANAEKSGLFAFITEDLRFDNPRINVEINRSKAAELGVNMQDLGNALGALLGGNKLNYFTEQGRSYEVIPQVPRASRLQPDILDQVYVRSVSGSLIALSTLITLETTVQPNGLTQFQQLNSATLSGVLVPGVTMGQAVSFFDQQAQSQFPEGFRHDYTGESRQFVQEGDRLVYAFGFALIVIFLVLSAQFESFRDPLIVLIAVPMSISGALLFLNTGLATVNIYTQVGLVTLIGLISKHGILIVEFANQLQEEEGLNRQDAAIKAASIRLRPVLMTTAAMVVAMLPLLIASGAGAKSRFDIGLVIGAGMSIGTCFTLFVVPTFYTLLARERGSASGSSPASEPVQGQAPVTEAN